eukprot:g3128.t1
MSLILAIACLAILFSQVSGHTEKSASTVVRQDVAEIETPLVDCTWDNSTAGFFVHFDSDQYVKKLRSCPKKWTDEGCTGDQAQPNAYLDCSLLFGAVRGGQDVLLNPGIGYAVIVYDDGTSKTIYPKVKGGLEWDRSLKV